MNISVPLEALALMDGEEAVSPESGDSVSVTISGRVSSLSDGLAVISVESANGVELGTSEDEPEEEAKEMSLDEERELVMNEIRKAGNVE